ncbi:hypothetical protein [Candidatus Amarobacter glycogenicus]|uniref:hypothetical protein n=1 Tax=Candidatus Amarobacter glycogenicus TaxID=3140699 RepID=UPI002A0AF373|nr:hypothetical protein [Dehalococcoidia bacterium]
MIAELELSRIPVLPGNEMDNEELPIIFRCPTCDEVTSGRKMWAYALAWELVHEADYPATERTLSCRKHEVA